MKWENKQIPCIIKHNRAQIVDLRDFVKNEGFLQEYMHITIKAWDYIEITK